MGLAVLDASVLIAQTDSTDAHHASARAAMVDAERWGEMIVPATAYAEVMTGTYLGGPESVEIASAMFEGSLRVVGFMPTMALTAARLRAATRLPLADAAVIATGIELDADVVLTTDRRWRKIDPRVRVI